MAVFLWSRQPRLGLATKHDAYLLVFRFHLPLLMLSIILSAPTYLDAGEDFYFAKDWLGHKNIQNTTIYSKFSTGTRDARARKMFPSNWVV